jgi:hypothetical protein
MTEKFVKHTHYRICLAVFATILYGWFSFGCAANKTDEPSAEEACEALQRAWCEHGRACLPRPSSESCGEQATRLCSLVMPLPGRQSNASQMLACAGEIPAHSCSAQSPMPGTACAAALTGAFAMGEPCQDHSQCQSGLCSVVVGSGCGYCNATLSFVGGTCPCEHSLLCDSSTNVCVTRAAEGHECGVGCAAWLHCDDGAQVCVGPPTQGEACTKACAAGLACVDKACRPPRGESEPCDPDAAECSEYQSSVLPSLYCDKLTKRCTPVPLRQVGQDCTPDEAAGLVPMCEASECLAVSETSRTCVAPVREGEPCPPTGARFTACPTGTHCQDGICARGFRADCPAHL